MDKKFYITTTLPYVNAIPHIGFAMEVVRADTIARYHRLLGHEVIFNTGTDEHGQKIFQKAKQMHLEPQKYCDINAKNFQDLKKILNLSFTNFIRTTDPLHINAAQEFWRLCEKNNDIYKAKYQIRYCVGCELEKTDSELVDGHCDVHPNLSLESMDEENYFFRFSKYQKPLLDLYRARPDFIIPQFRLDEIKNFVQDGLKDFSISRVKAKMPWGIVVPGDTAQVMYVWFDALINYISTLGWPENQKQFKQYWPGVQIAGKDNLRQQSAMWQAMLMSAGLPSTRQIYIEGFITSNGQKMSKSLGNVVDPRDLVKKYGTDALRYFLLREIPFDSDGDFSEIRFKEIYNSDLANGLGNLVARVAKLAEKANKPIKRRSDDLDPKISQHLEKYDFNSAIQEILRHIDAANDTINKIKPWEKNGKEFDQCLITLVSFIDYLIPNLMPFLPETAEKIKKQFTGDKIVSGPALFPRLN